MTRSCAACGALLDESRPAARYCGSTCRTRFSRGARAVPVPAGPSGGLVAAVEAELDAAGRRGSVAGQAALLLAHRVESGRDGGSAVASLARQLVLTMGEALAGAHVPESPLQRIRDELADRRRRLGMTGA